MKKKFKITYWGFSGDIKAKIVEIYNYDFMNFNSDINSAGDQITMDNLIRMERILEASGDDTEDFSTID